MMRYVPPKSREPQISLMGIPRGFSGTHETVKQIQKIIFEGIKDFYVRQKAIDILIEAGIKPKDYLGEIRTLFEWVQKNIRYTRDPFRVEVLHTARRMLELRAGDCDDITILLGTMLESIGHPIRLVIVGPDRSRPGLFSHIYLEVRYRNKWIPLDATMAFPIGWAPRLAVKKIIPLNRRVLTMNANLNLQGTNTDRNSTHPWLLDLLKTLRSQALPAKDGRIKELITLLRQRGVWGRAPRLQKFLVNSFEKGRPAPSRPRKLSRLVRVLRFWKILPPRRGFGPGGTRRPLPQQSTGRGAPQTRRAVASSTARLKGVSS